MQSSLAVFSVKFVDNAFRGVNFKLIDWGYYPDDIGSKLCEKTGETPESQTLLVLLLQGERIGHNAECVNQSLLPWQQLIFE